MKKKRTIQAWLMALLSMVLMLTGCKQTQPSAAESPTPEATAEPTAETASNDEIIILFTSDIHCGVKSGFGMVGLAQIKEMFKQNGYNVLLVDDGDAIQGDALGTLTKGQAIIDLMNAVHYDVAIPGNHEFDYGMDEFFALTKKAEFPYISCNFNKQGELMLEPYVIKEAAGKKIGFIGVTTPNTLTSSTPKSFMDEKGNYIYGFMQDKNGDLLINTIQENVDKVRAEGADYVILMGHVGNRESDEPYNFQTIIERTTGIDAFLDGHSHDTDQVTMNNKDGKPVVRSGCGTKMEGIGYLHISPKQETINGGLISWYNAESVPELFGLHNEMSEPVKEVYDALEETLKVKVGETPYDLVIYDPEERTDKGDPVRIVRKRETNLSDLVSDSIRGETGAEIALINGGGIRDNIEAGDITYGDIMRIQPYSNQICISEITGQQILDCLEWGARNYPEECPGLMHPSGLTYEIDASVEPNISIDTEGLFVSVDGEYRVKNVKVDGKPLDLKQKYRVAGADFILKYKGDGFAMFSEEDVVLDQIKLDNQTTIDYLKNTLNGVVPEEYDDPYGQGRITITGETED